MDIRNIFKLVKSLLESILWMLSQLTFTLIVMWNSCEYFLNVQCLLRFQWLLFLVWSMKNLTNRAARTRVNYSWLRVHAQPLPARTFKTSPESHIRTYEMILKYFQSKSDFGAAQKICTRSVPYSAPWLPRCAEWQLNRHVLHGGSSPKRSSSKPSMDA